MSPLLFSIFISSLGPLLNGLCLGIDLQGFNISAIFFADDLVIIGKSREALDKLMDKARRYFTGHKLDISESKSKVMTYNAATGKTTFEGEDNSSLSLDQVIVFKYLGLEINCSPYNLYKSFNDQVKRKAKNYLTSVLSLVRCGPDRAELAFTLWNSCALPSILYGAEIMPLTQSTIAEIEKCNTLIGKFMLQIPRSSADVSCYIDAGLRPISSIISEKVLLYAHSLMAKPSTYWPRLAMNENIGCGNQSPYTRYLLKLRVSSNCFNFLPNQIRSIVRRSTIIDILNQQRATSTTTFSMVNPGAGPSDSAGWFKPKPWLADSGSSKIFASFRVCNAGLGNRGPAKNGKFYKFCKLCSEDGLG